MLNEYHFKLLNEKKRKYLIQCRSMHIMASIMLIIYAMPYMIRFPENWIMLFGIGLPSLTILLVSIFKPRLIEDVNNNRIFRILEVGFLMMACMYYLQNNQTLPAALFGLTAIIMLILLWMENRILQDQYIVFDKAQVEVEFPLSTKKYTWSQLQAVMIKNEFITLSFKDNTIHQLKIKPDFSENEEGDFLFFCQDCIRT